jgi:hypothetical protein
VGEFSLHLSNKIKGMNITKIELYEICMAIFKELLFQVFNTFKETSHDDTSKHDFAYLVWKEGS